MLAKDRCRQCWRQPVQLKEGEFEGIKSPELNSKHGGLHAGRCSTAALQAGTASRFADPSSGRFIGVNRVQSGYNVGAVSQSITHCLQDTASSASFSQIKP